MESTESTFLINSFNRTFFNVFFKIRSKRTLENDRHEKTFIHRHFQTTSILHLLPRNQLTQGKGVHEAQVSVYINQFLRFFHRQFIPFLVIWIQSCVDQLRSVTDVTCKNQCIISRNDCEFLILDVLLRFFKSRLTNVFRVVYHSY